MAQDQANLNVYKIYLHVGDPFQLKHPLLINGREKVRIEQLKNSKAFKLSRTDPVQKTRFKFLFSHFYVVPQNVL